MLWYVVDMETEQIVYEADNYEEAFLKRDITRGCGQSKVFTLNSKL